MTAPDRHPDYDRLPPAIRAHVSAQEHLWMGAAAREHLIEDFCCPEPDEDPDE